MTIAFYTRPRPLLLAIAVTDALGFIPDWKGFFGVAGGLASAGLIALSLRSDKHIRSVPIFSLVVLLIGAAMSIAAVVTAAPSPDIQRFTGRGGKLIQTAGWNDSVVAPDGSIDYFFALTQWERLQNLTSHEVDKQIAKLTPQFVAAHTNALGKQVRQYHRLFMLPATGHCGGSTGPSTIAAACAIAMPTTMRSAPRRRGHCDRIAVVSRR